MHRPTDSVRIVLLNTLEPSQFLVVTEADDPDNWKLPGGKFEMGKDGIESPKDAAARELMEEVGVDAQAIDLQMAETLTNDDGVSARYIFVGRVKPEDIRPSPEIALAKWFTKQDLPDCKNRGHILSAIAAAESKT